MTCSTLQKIQLAFKHGRFETMKNGKCLSLQQAGCAFKFLLSLRKEQAHEGPPPLHGFQDLTEVVRPTSSSPYHSIWTASELLRDCSGF